MSSMRFETSQQMKLGQQMKLAPRMIQSMEILQLPLPALEERIEQELESNVTLEAGDEARESENADEGTEASDTDTEPAPESTDAGEQSEDFERLEAFETDNAEAIDNEYSASSMRESSDDFSKRNGSASADADGADPKLAAMANTAAREAPLPEQLLDQWRMVDVAPELRVPGEVIISHIDDDGYLRTELGEILRSAPPVDPPVTMERLERALLAVQLFLEPAGIAARDARECLMLQIDAVPDAEYTDELAHARKIVESHFEDLTQNRLPRIAEQTDMTMDEVRAAIRRLRRFSLHPGRQLVSDEPEVIIPDAIVEYDEDNDRYFAYLTDGRLPNLQVNREYARMARDRSVPKKDRDFLRTNLSNAQWLIDAVRQRRETLQRVIDVVIDAQRDVFDLGMEALKPLPMTQVADQLGMHVATVSRAVAGKYLQTPRGVMPLRKFFTGGTQTSSGEDVSWDAIKAALQDVIDEEDKSKPLSDEALVTALKERGIEIARRTVAKYRNQLGIPSARMRKKY